MILPTIVSLVLRFLFRSNSLPPSIGSMALYVATFLPALFLYKYLVKIGTARRDPTTGTLISYGEDLSQQGVTEWCFDILYVTCGSYSCIIVLSVDSSAIGACQIGSGAFGEWFWWLYMIVSHLYFPFLFDMDLNLYKIPLYAIFKLWISVISPMILGTKETTSTANGPTEKEPSGSKRQEKLRRRLERGDGRVRLQPSKK